MNIITGYMGEPHITSQQKRNINVGIFGSGAHIIKGVGAELSATVISANEVEIADGMIMCEGCASEVAHGTTESMTIDNGTQGKLRIDLIVARYNRNTSTGVEDMTLIVIKGTPSASDPQSPAYISGNISDGDTTVDFPLYQVNIDGISITSVDALVDVVSVPSMVEEVQNNLDVHMGKVADFYVFRFASISGSDDHSVIGAALLSILSRNLGDITFQCYIFRAGAWQLNGIGSIRNGDARATFINGADGQILVVSKTTTTALRVIKTYS